MANPVAFQSLLEINEPKIQSSSQAGPEINRDLEVLFETVVKMLRGTQGLANTVAVLTGGASGGGIPGQVPPPSNSEVRPFVYETTATVLAGTGESISTENAWETVAGGAPASALFSIIQFHMWSDSDDAGGQIAWRSANGAQEILAVVIRNNGTSDADRESIVWFLVPAGNFQYKADETSGAVEWKIRRLGYW